MATAPKKIPAIKVLCAAEGFRRGGRAFGPEAQTIPLSEFDEEQLAAIESEPRLITVRATIEAPAADGEGAPQT